MKYSVIPTIEQLADKYNAQLKIERAEDGSYIDCCIKAGALDIYIIVTSFDGRYFAYGIESSVLPRELYSDEIKSRGFSEKDRNEEILKNVELIISKNISFHPAPSLFNKNRGYILLDIDGIKTKIFLKDDWII